MAAPPEAWKQLLSIATLGVGRAAPATETLWPAGVDPMPAARVADTVLRAGLTSYLWQTAGGRAQVGAPSEIPRAPGPARPPVSEAAAWRLGRMLSGVQRELLPEWLALVESAGREIPAHWLPTALSSLTDAERQSFPAVLGPGAAWLAGLNPRWSAVRTAPSEELWSSGTLQERLNELILLRRHDPDRARDWLTQSWPSETPEGRETLIPALWTRLSAADEDFLEQALDDRRKEVRTVAADCLSRLPASAHARRNEQRLTALVTAASGKRRLTLAIELPQALDRQAQRDGLEVKRPSGMAIGERTYWLLQMLCRARPRYWTERLRCEADTFLDALARTEHGEALLPGLAAAAQMHPDPAWVRALCRRLAGGTDDSTANTRAEQVAHLLCALAAAEQQPLLEEILTGRSAHEDELLDELLGAELAWSDSTTARALSALDRQIQKRHWVVPAALATFARRAAAPLAQEAIARMLERLPEEARSRAALMEMAEILDFRMMMRKELVADG
jgi:hypothetical protein